MKKSCILYILVVLTVSFSTSVFAKKTCMYFYRQYKSGGVLSVKYYKNESNYYVEQNRLKPHKRGYVGKKICGDVDHFTNGEVCFDPYDEDYFRCAVSCTFNYDCEGGTCTAVIDHNKKKGYFCYVVPGKFR